MVRDYGPWYTYRVRKHRKYVTVRRFKHMKSTVRKQCKGKGKARKCVTFRKYRYYTRKKVGALEVGDSLEIDETGQNN